MLKENNKVLLSIFYMLVASAFIAGTAVVAKILGKDYLGEPLSPFQISHSRFLYGFVFVLIFSLILSKFFIVTCIILFQINFIL